MIKFIQLVYSNPIVKLDLSAPPLRILIDWHQVMGEVNEMKRAYSVSSYAKLYEKYCKENLPSEADGIFKGADEYYREFMRRDMPDLGKNMMAANMYDWFTIVSFYEASGHRLDGEVLLRIKRDAAEKMKFLGK